jgi:hypothetical protein
MINGYIHGLETTGCSLPNMNVYIWMHLYRFHGTATISTVSDKWWIESGVFVSFVVDPEFIRVCRMHMEMWWSPMVWRDERNIRRSAFTHIRWWSSPSPPARKDIITLVKSLAAPSGSDPDYVRLQSSIFSEVIGYHWTIHRDANEQGLTSDRLAAYMRRRQAAMDTDIDLSLLTRRRAIMDAWVGGARDPDQCTRNTVIVFRGVPDDAVSYDDVTDIPFIDDRAFMSCTTEILIANRFAGPRGSILGIVVPQGTPIAVVGGKWSQIVLPPGILRFAGPHLAKSNHSFFPVVYTQSVPSY